MKKTLFLLTFLFVFNSLIAQVRIEPMFWWVGMKNTELQIMCYAPKISENEVILKYDGVTVEQIVRTVNPNYIFINLKLAPNTKPGTFAITFQKAKKTVFTYNYELKARNNSYHPQAINTADVLYLIMPDRISNADVTNDNPPSMLEKADRINPTGRHGGDIKGIGNHLDYFKNLGVTTLWVNPVLENNMPEASYHGYAITNFYRIDERLGSNEDFNRFVDTCHYQGLKVVMDMILNHCGSYHWWMKDLPSPDWVSDYAKYGQSNFRAMSLIDPYASNYDKDKMSKGWFVTAMPDLNQENPILAKYLIQNTIWWIESSKIDGIRMDTQPYPNQKFMSDWAMAIEVEYPGYFIVGEAWLAKPSWVAYFMESSKNPDGYNSHFSSVFDFPLHFALKDGLNEEGGWDKGMVKIYETLTEDFLYSQPNKLVVFPDNHDTQRFFSMIGEDMDKFKIAMAFTFTTRGIPMLYYGTELLMTSDNSKGDGDKRKDFPGGWKDDKINMFDAAGRTGNIKEAFDYIQLLLNWRKDNKTVQFGKLKQFVPENNVYVYARYDEKNTVLVILNNDTKEQTLTIERYAELLNNYTSAWDVTNKKSITDLKTITIKAKSALILELKK